LSSYYEKFLATGEVKCIDEEIPFEIPATWEWVRLSNVSVIQEGPGIRSFQYMPSGIQLLTVTNILEGKVDMKKQTKFISEQEYNDKYTHFTLKQGDIVCACSGGSWGKSALFNVKRTPVILNTSTLRLRYFSDLGCNLYLYHITKSSFFKNQLAEQLSGMQPNFGYTHYSKVLLPLPPLREQKRISELIEQILPYIFKYNSAQEILNNLNNDISIKLKKSILQEAIQGKLVPQIAEEGTAQELLEQIKFEKQKLVKESKLKKSALADSIIYKGDDNKYYERINEQIVEIELPFEYPNSWVVLRLKDICQLTDGEKRTGKGICLDAKYLRGKSSAAVIDKGKFVYAGDNIILVDGENSGEVFSVPQDGYMGSTFKQLWLSSVMWKPYILAFILFYKEELKNSKRGAAIPHLNKELFYNLPIGIPPFAEQQRIAERITELSQLLK
jgi:type I restriction enzyme S subunit